MAQLPIVLTIALSQFCAAANLYRFDNESRYPESFAVASYLQNGGSQTTCGIYCLWLGAQAMGYDIPLSEVLSGQFVDPFKGSSVSDLQQCARAFGVASHAAIGLGIDDLKLASHPILLQLRSSRQIGMPKHWVLFLGESNGKAVICDLPKKPNAVNYADLMAVWSGVGLRLQPQDSSSAVPYSDWLESQLARISYLWFPIIVAVLICCISGCSERVRRILNRSSKGIAVIIILILAVAWSIAHEFLCPFSISRNPDSIRLTTCSISRQIVGETCESPDPTTNQYVDCRLPTSFSNGHIDGAVSLPLSSSVFELRRFLETVPLDVPLVVYGEPTCAWPNLLAFRLKCLGYDSVRVLAHGYDNSKR